MSSNPEEANQDPLKPALWASIGSLVDSLLGLQYEANASPQFIGALTELVYAQIQATAGEVEAFAKHAGRTVVTKEDAMMLARKNESLQDLLRKHVPGAKTGNL